MKTYVHGPVKHTCMKKPGTLKGALVTILTKKIYVLEIGK